MNKEKLIKFIDEEIKREKAVIGNDGCFVGEVKGTLLGRIQEAERIKEFIQSDPEETCTFNYDAGTEAYICSKCGLTWALTDGTPEENEMYYCPKCSRKIVEKAGE